MKALAIGAIRAYQTLISPLLPPSCRFHPTCSEYTRQAIERYGFGRGILMGMRRIIRCNPFCVGGHDPVR
ncbi:MAG TPA: membrane protein insertion efficiency factor YidD [Blastocatellia bacterium]|nr:membrane protein insertion efficiency factor YidD [Blastocatellia bacterium]